MKFVMIATLAAQKTNGIQQVVFISVIKFQLHRMLIATKGGFFSESAMRFLDLQISKKNIPKSYPELEI